MKNTQIENMYVYIGVSFLERKGEFFFRERVFPLSARRRNEGKRGVAVYEKGEEEKEGKETLFGIGLGL